MFNLLSTHKPNYIHVWITRFPQYITRQQIAKDLLVSHQALSTVQHGEFVAICQFTELESSNRAKP